MGSSVAGGSDAGPESMVGLGDPSRSRGPRAGTSSDARALRKLGCCGVLLPDSQPAGVKPGLSGSIRGMPGDAAGASVKAPVAADGACEALPPSEGSASKLNNGAHGVSAAGAASIGTEFVFVDGDSGPVDCGAGLGLTCRDSAAAAVCAVLAAESASVCAVPAAASVLSVVIAPAA